MKKTVLLITLLVSLSLSADEREATGLLSGVGKDEAVDAITFSDRAVFAEHLQAYLKKETRYLRDWEREIKLPGPPANSSERTVAELTYLIHLEGKRTRAQEADVVREIKVAGMKLGPYQMGELLGTGTPFPELRQILMEAQHDMEIIVFCLKASFNRARPTHLTGELEPSIEVPPHPAYPSGHATQAHVLAYLLAKVDPENAVQIIEDAGQIARNREIAGVHYPSDSEAGRMLARQIVDGLLKNESFSRLYEEARRSRL